MPSLQAISVLSMVLGLFAVGTTATIHLGHDLENNVIWIHGQSSCTASVSAPSGSRICDHLITLSNGFKYTIKGCDGGDFFLLNEDGSFNSHCQRVKDFPTDCGVVLTHTC